MSILIEKGVVLSRREGVNVFYKLSDERITKACDLMREVLIKNLEQNNYLLKDMKKFLKNINHIKSKDKAFVNCYREKLDYRHLPF